MKIPKIIHGIWLGGRLPLKLKNYRRSWKRHHKDWDFILWTEDDILDLENQALYDDAKTYAEKSDVVRLEILKEFGGVYVDMDFSCLKNIEPLIDDVDFFIVQDLKVWKENHPKYDIPYLNNAFMGCTSGHRLIKGLVDALPGFVEENKHHHVCFRTGPGFVSQLLKDEDILRLENWKIRRKYAKHHYENSWKEIEPQPRHWPED